MLFIGRICVAALLLIAAPLLNTLDTPLGSALCLAAFLGMLLDSRQILFTYVLRKHTLFATRVADAAETICIMLILPLAYLAITL